MNTSISGMKRTDWCGELTITDAGREVCVNGWCDRTRDNGGVLFLLLSLGVQVGMRYLVSYSAFTHPVGSEEISSVMGSFLNSIGYYPLGGLPVWAQGLLVTVLPAAALVTVLPFTEKLILPLVTVPLLSL